MSLSSVTSKVIYVGDGATLIFPYTFKVFAEGDLTVSDYNVATGSSTVLTLNTDYLVDGVGIDAGGNVTLSGSYTSLPTGSKLVIQREMDLTQEVDYVENDPFPAQTLENALDKITMITQQLQEQCDRAVKSDISTVSSGIVYVDKEASASSAVVSLAASVASNSSAVVSLSQAAIAVSSATVAVSKATACASSAVVSLDAAVLSSGYAGAIDFSKDTDPLLTSNSDVLVATQKAIKSYAASKVSPTFLGTVNTVTLISTLVSSTTSYVTGTANATTLAVTLITATSVNVSGTVNATNVKGDGSLLTGIVTSNYTNVAGDNLVSSGDTEVGANYSSYTKIKEFTVAQPGTYRFKWDMKISGGYTVYGKLYKNDITAGVEKSTTSATYATQSDDLAVVAGDKVELYGYRSSTNGAAYCQNFRVYVSLGGYVNLDS